MTSLRPGHLVWVPDPKGRRPAVVLAVVDQLHCEVCTGTSQTYAGVERITVGLELREAKAWGLRAPTHFYVNTESEPTLHLVPVGHVQGPLMMSPRVLLWVRQLQGI